MGFSYNILMKIFYQLLINSLFSVTTNNFVWFAVTYWSYLETKSVVTTSIVGGLFLVNTAFSGFWLGSFVDKYRKKSAMIGSSIASLILFGIGLTIFLVAPEGAFSHVGNAWLWFLIVVLMFGVNAGNIRNIAISTSVTLLVPEDRRDKANGMIGTVNGISFGVTAIASGLVLGFFGMWWVLVAAILITVLAIIHLFFVPFREDKKTAAEKAEKKVDVLGTISVIKGIPGMFALLFFTTFNNFLGGVFMSLMDAYGLSLVSVKTWGTLWGFISLGFILGGLYISKKGLGENPLRKLFIVNIILWIDTIFFAIQPSIVLLAIGMFIYVCLVPFLEATEQTIVQRVVPYERQGRVFGFSQSIEQAASPIMAFVIGPIAQYIFIPFMTTGKGVGLIGSWYGVGVGRGIALVFTMAGVVGLIVTLVSMRSHAYKLLYERYKGSKQEITA